jgi:hypothetical protein
MMMIFYGVRDYFSLLEGFCARREEHLIPLRIRFPFHPMGSASFVSLSNYSEKSVAHNGSFLCTTITPKIFSHHLRIFNSWDLDFFAFHLFIPE